MDGGWDRLAALKIVFWPTHFLTRHSASLVGRGYFKKKSPPQFYVYSRVHTNWNDPKLTVSICTDLVLPGLLCDLV